MKPRHILTALTALWALFVALEGVSSLIRFLYSRKMNAAVRAASGFVNGAKAVFMVVLAVSNVMLFAKHVDDKE